MTNVFKSMMNRAKLDAQDRLRRRRRETKEFQEIIMRSRRNEVIVNGRNYLAQEKERNRAQIYKEHLENLSEKYEDHEGFGIF